MLPSKRAVRPGQVPGDRSTDHQPPHTHPHDTEGPAVHLLQLAEDTALGWGWGYAGTLYFTIPVKALATSDFCKAVAQVFCC
ncbi:DUF1963 domain-containing protein [Streptomyces sp. NPDC001231]|uniref:DUF1963 domain-containing protein n=1 Tax=unclassified Streptomyces TaxID=2593676 RepID=UPI0036C9455E